MIDRDHDIGEVVINNWVDADNDVQCNCNCIHHSSQKSGQPLTQPLLNKEIYWTHVCINALKNDDYGVFH